MEVLQETIESSAYRAVCYKELKKIRVLLIITGLANGGATNIVLDIAKHFKDDPDFDIHLLTGPIPKGRQDVTYLAYEQGIPTSVIPSLINSINPFKNLKAVTDIWRIISRGNYDIVHTHSSVAGMIGRLAAFMAQTPSIIHHVHGWGLQEGMSRGTRMLYLFVEKICARFTDRLIAVSKPDIEKGQAYRIAKKNKFALIYNGIDLDKFQKQFNNQEIRQELGLDRDCKLVGMIGRLDRQKNPMDFIRAASIVNEGYEKVQFVIIGGGPLRPECERLIDELNLKNKFFLLGYRNDVARILSTLTMTIMSSLWEGLPIAFLEAISAGKPIIANNVDGVSDVVIDGKTGFLVPKHQPCKMAEKILYLLKNEQVCSKMGKIAQQRADYFSKQRMLRQIEDLYRELFQ